MEWFLKKWEDSVDFRQCLSILVGASTLIPAVVFIVLQFRN